MNTVCGMNAVKTNALRHLYARIPEDLYEQFRAEAGRSKRSMSAQVVWLVENWVTNQEPSWRATEEKAR